MRSSTNVNCELAAILFLVLVSRSAVTAASPRNRQATQSAAETVQQQTHVPSALEIAGLRGPVERCTDETRLDQGNWRMIRETTYDPDGRISQVRSTNDDGTNNGISKGVGSFTYDAEGHLLRTVWTGQDGSSDTLYYYDSQGRLIGVTGQDSRWTTSFEYDDQGRKTRIVTSTGPDMGVDPFFVFVDGNADLFVAPPDGGWVITPFNESGQPIESRVYGTDGELITRLNRSYDKKRRVVESAYMVESLESLREMLRETRAGLRSNPEGLEAQLAQVLGDRNVMYQVSYVYDDQARVSEKHYDSGRSENTITKITYNDHGDEAEEIRTTSHPPKPSEEFDTRFEYQYDSFGNWTERVMISGKPADEPLKVIDHREITYY